jgi:hypothetical protein
MSGSFPNTGLNAIRKYTRFFTNAAVVDSDWATAKVSMVGISIFHV